MLPEPPDGGSDGGVAHGDDDGGDDEDGEGHQAHVDLPLPRGAEVYPALGAVFCRKIIVVLTIFVCL